MELTLESIIVDDLAKQLQKSVDFDILCDTLVPFGWAVVEIKYGPKQRWDDVKQWAEDNSTGEHQEHNGKWLFKNSEDAIMFKLKWA